MRFDDLKVVLVFDWLDGAGGGERVLYDMHVLFPNAPIYTLVYDENKTPSWLKGCDVRTTYIQKWPILHKHHKALLQFMPKAWESLDLNEYDLVISCCSSCCKGVLTKPDALHICYIFTPTRYLWDLYYEYRANAGKLKSAVMPSVVHKVRQWDYLAAQRPDYFVSDSDFAGERVKKYYRRDVETIYPGVHINEYPIVEEPDDYYLVVARFVRYKRVDIAIEACNRLGRKLKVIGSGGEEEKRLREIAGPTIEFMGRVSDEAMEETYSKAKAFLFPGVEDFGITPVEAMSAGVPVLAFGRGGGTETVVDGKTGRYFFDQSVEGLISCIEAFEREGVAFSREQIREYSKKFSQDRFYEEFGRYVQEKLTEKGILS